MSSQTSEIITLQIGHYANFVGTHWWNIQESSFVYDPDAKVEIDHAVLFREGETSKRESTFTPRLLSVDLRGSLGGLRRHGRLYGEERPPPAAQTDRLWHGDTVRHKQEARRRTLLQRLDGTGDADDDEKDVCQPDGDDNQLGDTAVCEGADPGAEVKVWSDFLATHLNPWTIHLLTQHVHHNTNDPFDVFGYGESQYLREDFRDNFEDRLRAYAEECDHLAGFHLLADGCDGFGGVAAGALCHLSDEYPRRPALLAPLQPAAAPAPSLTLPQAVHRAVNAALTLDAGGRHAALCTPLSVQSGWTAPLVAPSHRRFENLEYRAEAPYESSALLAAALDTVTLPWRRKRDTLPLYDVTSGLSTRGRTVAAVSLSLPLGIGPAHHLATWLDSGNLKFHSLTPGVSDDADETDVWSGCAVLRGIPDKQLRPAGGAGGGDPWKAVVAQWSGDRQLACRLREPMRTAAPFPAVFGPAVAPDGLLRPRQTNTDGVLSVPAAASLQCRRAAGDCVTSLHAIIGRFNIAKFHRFSAAGLELDDFAEVRERLSDLATCYRSGGDML